MRTSDIISGGFWLVVGLSLSFFSLTYQIGNITDPGPGFLPLGLGLLLTFFSLVLLGQARKLRPAAKGKGQLFSFAETRDKAYVVLCVFLAALCFEKIGYLLTIFLFIFFLMLGAELQNWKKHLLFAFLTTLGIYLVFTLILKVPLPRGFLRI